VATKDHDDVLALHDAFIQANRTADWSFLEKHMYPGDTELVWYNLNQSNYHGVTHIVDLWKMLKAAMGDREATLVTSDDRVTVVGDLALVTYLLHFEADFGEAGSFSQDARDTEVWQRVDGDWKMLHFHCSNHVPAIMGGL